MTTIKSITEDEAGEITFTLLTRGQFNFLDQAVIEDDQRSLTLSSLRLQIIANGWLMNRTREDMWGTRNQDMHILHPGRTKTLFQRHFCELTRWFVRDQDMHCGKCLLLLTLNSTGWLSRPGDIVASDLVFEEETMLSFSARRSDFLAMAVRPRDCFQSEFLHVEVNKSNCLA
jgi:hypothetical protein